MIGTGITGMRQLSREAEQALRACRKVFHLTSVHDELAKLCDDVVNNADEYWTGEKQGTVYVRIIDKIMAEVAKGPGVANVIYGHPLFFDDINKELIRRCRAQSLDYVVLPGISSLDTLSTDFEIDYGDGLQVFEVQHMIRDGHPLNPHIHAIILQIGQFGTNLTIPEVPSPEGRFKPLEEYLVKFYPPEHQVFVAFSDRGDNWRRFQLRCAINELDKNRKKIFKGTTLYIPPV